MKIKEQPEVRKDMDVIEHDKTIQHTYTQMKVKEQLEIRKYIDVNEHDRISITLVYKLK
jgi:hypothetical protein